MTHGGKRAGAGKPKKQVDEKRVAALKAQGLSLAAIGARLGVGKWVIARVLNGAAPTAAD